MNQPPPEAPKPPALPPPAPLAEADVQFVASAEDISAEDQAFIDRVFDSVRDVEFVSPPPPPPKNLTGVDKKMQSLRDTVRRLERELARVGHIWRIKQKRVAEVDSIIQNEASARQQADHKLAQTKEHAARAAAAARAEIDRLQQQLAQLGAEKVEQARDFEKRDEARAAEIAKLEERIAKEEREKASVVADAKHKLEQAQTVFKDLRDKSTQVIAALEAQVRKLEEDLQAARDSTSSMGKRLADREQTIKVLTDEMTQARADFTDRLDALKRELAAKSEEAARLTREIEAKQAPAATG